LYGWSKKISVFGGILALLSTLFAGYMFVEKRYALAEELNKVKQRLDYKILSDQQKSVQDRIWKLDDRYQGKPMPSGITEEYRQLKSDNEKLKKQLEMMEKK